MKDIKDDIKYLLRKEKHENLLVLIQNQMKLIKRLPNLHVDSLQNYNKTCQNYFEQTFKIGEKLLEQTRFLEYLDNTIEQKEIEMKKREQKHDEEIVQIQRNSKAGLRILERKLEYMERAQNSKEQMIVNLKKEIQNMRIESSSIIDRVRDSLNDIGDYQKLHKKLLERENILIRNIGTSEKHDREKLKDMILHFSSKFLENIDTGIHGIMKVSDQIGKQFKGLEGIMRGIKGFEKYERQVIKNELGNAKNALGCIKRILDKDRKPFGVIVRNLKDLCEDYDELFEKFKVEIEQQATRYNELNGISDQLY